MNGIVDCTTGILNINFCCLHHRNGCLHAIKAHTIVLGLLYSPKQHDWDDWMTDDHKADLTLPVWHFAEKMLIYIFPSMVSCTHCQIFGLCFIGCQAFNVLERSCPAKRDVQRQKAVVSMMGDPYRSEHSLACIAN